MVLNIAEIVSKLDPLTLPLTYVTDRSVTTEKPVNTENHERNDICRNSDDINIQPPEVRPKHATKSPKYLDDYVKY